MTRSILFVFALAAVTVASAAAAEHRTLFVGNSYTFANNNLVADGFLQLLVETSEVEPEVEVVAKGGYSLAGHLADAGQEGEKLHELLALEGAVWNVVVLQEQSVIPAYHEAVAFEWYDSLAASAGLDGLAEAAGADTVFLMTWGRRDGLSQDAEMLPDYPTMQALLAGGYEKYQAYTSTPERPTLIAPAGLAWQVIWDDAVTAGEDPLDPDGLFWNLYTSDGSHPSVLGSYLAALVVFATVTGTDPAETLWQPDSVTSEEALTLRSVAQRVVLGEPVQPTVEVVEDSGADVASQPADLHVVSDLVVAPDLSGGEAVGPPETPRAFPEATVEMPEAPSPEAEPSATSKGSGCGVSAGPSSPMGFMLLLALLFTMAAFRLLESGRNSAYHVHH